ncbi:unnamed protein product [Paramecium pentaurelia]|uniref:Uncharacterized protein n=1 Tax=Paramecium pentaurelia TaxID=43138 RepID=A0A8S1USW7_9CILI|nr:unnamed protein product [Paramecium pentaurelia]
MNLVHFDSLCNDCCFSRTLESKQQAEQIVYQFIEDIRNIDILCQIIQQTQSGSTLFVISEYIAKIVVSERSFKGFQLDDHSSLDGQSILRQSLNKVENDVLDKKCIVYETLVSLFCVNLQKQQENHVQNSICNLVGLLIQQIMMMSSSQFEKYKLVFNLFFQGNQPYLVSIGFKLIQHVLQNLQLYSSYDSYVSYRKIIFQFQNSDIIDFMSIVCTVLKQCTVNLYKPALTSLKDILMFNFNISYFELEQDFDPNDQNNVSFPDKFAEYFNDRQLLDILFKIVAQYNQIDSSLALLALKSLKRMASSKKRIFNEKIKKRLFAKEMYQGCIFLFEKVQQANEEIVSDILELNTKLNNCFGLRQIRFDFTFSQQWLYCLQTFCIQILQKQMKIKDLHMYQMIELMKKLVKCITDFKLDITFKQSISKALSEIGKSIIHLLLNSPNSFFHGYTPQNHKKLKHTLKEFFENLFPILSIDLTSHLKMIYHSFKNAAQDQEKFIIELSLINYIVINPQILEKNNDEIVQMIQTLIKDSLNFLQVSIHNLPPLVIMSAMSLADNLFQFCLSESDESIGRQRFNKTFFDIFIKPIQIQPQQATNQLLQFIILQLQIENKEIIEYALVIMKETIVRLKHHLYNEAFQSSNVVTQIKGILLNLKNTALQKDTFLSCRTLASEILSILLFDTAYDNYIESIIQLNQYLTIQPTQQSILIYLYEMLGYFRHVDTSKIFRLLIKQHLIKIADLTRFILIDNPQQFQMCKLCLKLMVAITENKSLRYQYHSSSIVQIELVRTFQNILTTYLQHLMNAIQNEKVKQEYSAEICRLVGLIFKIMNNIMKGRYISQSCQLLFADRKYLDQLITALEVTLKISNYIIMYNKACLQIVQVLQVVSSSQLQLFELNPQSLTTLMVIIESLQKHMLGQLSQEYKMQTISTYHQPIDKVTLDHTTEIILSVLEFVSEEQQLSQMGMLQSFVQPLDSVVELVLKELLLCLINGQCSQQTNQKITRQVFAIMCTFQQVFVTILSKILLRSDQQLDHSQLQILTQDLDLRIKQQNEEQFKKNFNLFMKQFGI